MSQLIYIAGYCALLLIVRCLIYASGIVRYIDDSRVAVVEKLWSGSGSIKGGLIALEGQAGFQHTVNLRSGDEGQVFCL